MQTIDPKYKTFWRRFWAYMLDTLIVIFPISYIETKFKNPSHDTTLFFEIAPYIALISYRVIMHYKSGQTIGKQVTKVKVINSNETVTLSFGTVLKREVLLLIAPCIWLLLAAMFVPAGETFDLYMLTDNGKLLVGEAIGMSKPAWEMIGVLVLLANAKRMAPHDQFAKTVVIRLDLLNDIPAKYQK